MHFLLAQCYSAERIWILFTSYTYTRATRTQRALTHACTQGNIMRSRSLAHVRIFIYTPPTLSLRSTESESVCYVPSEKVRIRSALSRLQSERVLHSSILCACTLSPLTVVPTALE
jgi:hypothetical protein